MGSSHSFFGGKLLFHLKLILFGGDMFVSFEQLNKVAAVIETAVIGHGRDWGISGAQLATGPFNPVVV